MATFTITGSLDGRQAAVVWTDGELAGDDDAIGRVLEAVGLGEEIAQTPTGPTFVAALEPETIAVLTILSIFDRDRPLDYAGEVAIATDDLPPGATP